MRDYYRILGLRPDATREEIKDAWNFSVKAFHPDKFAGSSERQQAVAQERTKAINEAYEVLSDPVKRASYDREYAKGPRTHSTTQPPPRPPPPPPRPTRSAQTASSGNRRRRTAPRKPSFDFRWIVVFFKNCIRSFNRGSATLFGSLRKSVVGITKFFGFLNGKISKVSSEVFSWRYRKRRALAGAMILLFLGTGLGIWLSQRQPAVWPQVLRGVLTKTTGWTHKTFAGLWHSSAKPIAPSTPPAITPNEDKPPLVLSSPASLTDQLLREGIDLRDHGDTPNALARFEEALNIEPNNAAVLVEMGKTYGSMRRFDRVNEISRKLEKLGISGGMVHPSLVPDLNLVPPSKPGHIAANPSSKFEQAQQALRQRDFATALKLVDEADHADPNQAATINLRGEILMQQEQFDQAEAAFKKATKLDPKLREAQYNLAQIPFKKKEYAKARDRFEALYKRTPGGDKNQAAELIKFKIYMTLLLEGKKSRAHAMMDEFRFTSDTPALYYAQAAWEFQDNNPEKAADWTASANKIYSSALNSVFADAFYDVGWMQRPTASVVPAPTPALASASLEPAGHPGVAGNPEGPVMGITEVKAAERPDPDAETNLALQIGIKKQPRPMIDNTKVVILVEFYDTVGDKDVELTDADINYEWLTPKHDWTDTNPEMLQVTYVRPKGKPTSANPKDGQRKYLGYRIRLYYNNRLQAVQAKPGRLIELFPPSESLVDREPESPSVPTSTSTLADSLRHDVDRSPYATAADFAKYAIKLREQGLHGVPPLSEPTTLHPAINRYPWKTNVVTTVFWIGEKQVHQSVWDKNWQKNYGGVDNPDPSARRSYLPIGFIPQQNPFYCALPYNDVTHGQFKPEAPLVIPWFKPAYIGPGQSVCWHRWLAIRKGDRTCYAEWEDCGPFRTDHFQYVFGNERPKPNASHGAGLSVSPAVRDYLGLAPTDVTDWQFVEVRDVPQGPWQSYGENNHFVIARRQFEQRAREQTESEQITKKEQAPSATPAVRPQ